MKRFSIYALVTFLLVVFSNQIYSQINSGNPSVPFGSNSNYQYGIMPTNLPSGGTYGGSQIAADAYNAWKSAYVESCGTGKYRVKFDDVSYTVSEGIAYGMLLSAYAADKDLFDGLWAYYQQFMNGNGAMNWKISGCNSVNQSGGATDAELDAAMALIIAAEQWSGSSAEYTTGAQALIATIKNTEMTSGGQTLNGDLWGNTNTCRNPSYQSPAYYKQYANIDASNSTYWNTTAINAASSMLLANRNSTSGLVSNWCDDSGTENTCGNTGSGAAGYGADACRNPWRTTMDYLWHGDDASDASIDINVKLVNFVNGYESSLKGPISNRNVPNPSSGSYVNGSYTTLGLPTMTSSAAQSSLNKCYTAIANLTQVDYYFNYTMRALSLFMMTGNFWAPGASGFVFPPSLTAAVTNGAGTEITLSFNKTLTSTSITASSFTLKLNGTTQTSAITNVAVSGQDLILTLAASATPQPGQSITISYSGTGNVSSTEGAALEALTNEVVLNLLEGNETILDDCDDGNELNNVGGIWFTFNDKKDQDAACQKGSYSTISPLSGKSNPFAMSAPGYDGSSYAVNASITLGVNYTPFNNGACAGWTNPAYVGIGTWVDDDETNTMDWTSGTGVSFWYKGPAATFQVITEEVTDYCFHKYDVPAAATWSKVTVLWADLAQPTWGTQLDFSAANVQKLQWQFEKGTSADGDFWIDDVRIMNMPPVALTALTIDLVSDVDLAADDSNPNADPLALPVASGAVGDTLFLVQEATPANASYPVVFWSSSDETVATVDYQGRVLGVGFGEAVITATSKMHQSVSATYTVKVPAPAVKPQSISITPSTITLALNATELLLPSFTSSQGSVTETGLTWTTSNAAIVDVSSNGTLTAKSVGGPVTITATSTADAGVSTTVSVTVQKIDVVDIVLSSTAETMAIGDEVTITTTFDPLDATEQGITWGTSNSTIATVVDGVITAKGTGSCNITATSIDNPLLIKTIAITVSGILPTSITLNPLSQDLEVNEELTLIPTVLPGNATDQSLIWTSADDLTVSVTPAGVVTAKKLGGPILITATSFADGSVKGTSSITVVKTDIQDITISSDVENLVINEEVTIYATIVPDNTTIQDVTWETSDALVATVVDGVITAKGIGSCNITVTSDDNSLIVKTIAVTVSGILPTSILVTPTTNTIEVGEHLPLNVTVLPGTASNKTYTWTTSNDAVVDVLYGDVFVGLAIGGPVTLTATSVADNSITKSVTVNVVKTDVTDLTVSPTTQIVEVGDVVIITPSITPDTATVQTVTWSENLSLIGTVTNGTFTAKSAGTVTVTATSDDNSSITATATFTVVDKSTLLSEIASTQSIHNNANEGGANGDYPVGAKADLQTAIDAAQVVYDNSTALQTTINAAVSNLQSALVTFQALEISVDKTALDALIASSTTTVNNASEGTANGEYPVGSKATLQSVIDAAQVVSDNISATNAEVTQAQTDLQTALNIFIASEITIAPVDNSALLAEIGTAQTLHDGATEGLANGNYTLGAKASLQTAIDAAQLVYDNNASTQSEVNVAVVTLQSEVTAFNGKLVTVSTTALESAITSAESKLVGTTEGAGNGMYPVGSKATLQAAIDAAQAVSDNIASSQQEVDNAIVTLNTAVTSFQNSVIEVITTALESAIAAAENVQLGATEGTGNGMYPVGSKATLQTAIDAAQAVSDNIASSQQEVDDAQAAVNQAVIDLQAQQIVVTKTQLLSDIQTTQAIHDIAVTGTADGEYPTGAKADLQTALDAAQLVYDNVSATQLEVNNSISALAAALATFEGLVNGTSTGQVTAIVVTPATKTLGVGEHLLLSVTVLPGTATDKTYTWATSNDAVVDVLNGNTFIAKSIGGPVTLTATSVSNPAISKTVTVNVVKTDVTQLTASVISQIVEINDIVTIIPTIVPDTATVQTVSWASDFPLIGSVTNGVFTAHAVGTATVTATADDNSAITANSIFTVVDKSTLLSNIASTQAIHNAASQGSANGEYPVGAKADLQTAIDAAQVVYDNTMALQTTIDAAVSNLQTALATFQALEISVDKTALDALISSGTTTVNGATEGTANGEYPIGSKTTLQTAIDAAQLVSDNTAASQAEVTQATTSLQNAINIFVASEITVGAANKTALLAEIGSAQTLHDGATEGMANGEYALGSKADLQTAIDAAQVVYDNATASQSQVNVAVITLQSEVAAFQALVVSVDKAALVTKINNAQVIHTGATEGLADGNYPAGSKADLQTAIDVASSVNLDATATQTDVNTAVTNLQAAITTFQSLIIGVNKTALDAQLLSAQSVHNAATEGTGNNMYPVGSKATLQSAISAAQAVSLSSTSSQTEVDNALATLTQAVATFQALKITVNATQLLTNIQTAQAILDVAVEGTANGNQIVGSKAIFQSSIDAAQLVYNNANSSQADINTAITDLATALTLFQSSTVGVIKTTLASTIAAAQTTHNTALEGTSTGQYPVGSKTTLQTAINVAKGVNTSSSASQADVNAAVTTLENAVTYFNSLQITVDKSQLSLSIDAAQLVHNAAVVGTTVGTYTAEVKATFATAINAARYVLINTAATQAEVLQAILDLAAAQSTFTNSVNGVNKLDLQAEIVAAQALYTNSTEGSNEGLYIIGSKTQLLIATNAASSINSDAGATQTQVDNAIVALKAAEANFLTQIVVVDRTLLDAQVITSQGVISSSTEGVGNGMFPVGSQDILQTAITTASNVSKTQGISQSQINTAILELQSATSVYLAKQITVNFSALESAIDAANLVENTSVIGTEAGQFPVSGLAPLQLAILKAQNVVDNPNSTQAQVTAAIAPLEQAVLAFQALEIQPKVLSTLIFDAEMDNKTYLNTFWYSYNDEEPGGLSTVSPYATVDDPFLMAQSGAQGTAHAAKIDYTLGKGTLGYNPFVGMGMAFLESEEAYDLSASTGISFWYKSDNSFFLEVALTSVTDSDDFNRGFVPATEWTEVVLSWSDFVQYGWGVDQVWDASLITKLQFKVQAADATTGGLWIDEIRILGTELDLPEISKVNMTALNGLLDIANQLYGNMTTGSKPGQYPLIAAIEFFTAIQQATSVSHTTSASEAVVDAAYNELQDAINDFLAARNTAVGIELTENDISISTYPNPCTKSLTVSSSQEIVGVSIITLSGSKAMSVEVQNQTTVIDVSSLANGVYLVEVTLSNGVIKTKKITKK